MRRAAGALLALLVTACASGDAGAPPAPARSEAPPPVAVPAAPGPADGKHAPSLVLPGEKHFKSVRQLTFGGQNAEAYWSWDDRALILQITNDTEGPGASQAPGAAHLSGMHAPCDQIFIMDVASGHARQITHSGRATCSYFLPGDRQILFASTFEHSPDCPPEPDRSKGYVWPLYEYDIFTANLDGTGARNITHTPGYDAEATVAADGRIVFTSARSGDLELWSMNAEGGDLHQITHSPGYDGGAFFSPDGTKLVWRASRPESAEELAEYQELLGRGLVRPTRMEIWIADADGSNAHQLTNLGKASFAPYFTPDGRSIIFASNVQDPKGRAFELWKIDVDGSNLEQVTHDSNSFASFPMFSRDGRWLAFSSNRNGSVPHETNVFVAEWVP